MLLVQILNISKDKDFKISNTFNSFYAKLCCNLDVFLELFYEFLGEIRGLIPIYYYSGYCYFIKGVIFIIGDI